MNGLGWFGMGDVTSDAMTWITYGNDIIRRQATDSRGIGAEAGKAANNISNFLANRGTELDTVSPGTVNQLDDMVDKLSKIATGNFVKADDSFTSAFGAEISDEATEAKRLAAAGAAAVAAAPGQAYNWTKGELEKAFNKGKEVVNEATIPLVVIVAGILGVAYIMYGNKK